MNLSELTTEYQLLLEKHRQVPDCEDGWAMLCETKSAMETAWLRLVAGSDDA